METASALPPSYEGLRVRGRAQAPDPRQLTALRQPQPAARSRGDEFFDFVSEFIHLVFLPITVPLKWTHRTLTSPLTISLILKLILLFLLTLGATVFSILATGAFWYSWKIGGEVEAEGWLMYGSKTLRTPHASISLLPNQFQEDLRYDVSVEMELVRPLRGSEEMGNFMLSLDLRSARDPLLTVKGTAQPSLPPPPLTQSLIPLPSLPTYLLPPCIIPWPFRSLCPSRLLGYDDPFGDKIRRRRAKGSLGSPVGDKDVVLLRKDLMEGVVIRPSRGGDAAIGSAFVSIGREDVFPEQASEGNNRPREVRTTGWVAIRFLPRPQGVRWLLSLHPIPPLIILPPIAVAFALSSSLIAFILITYCFRSPRSKERAEKPAGISNGKAHPAVETGQPDDAGRRAPQHAPPSIDSSATRSHHTAREDPQTDTSFIAETDTETESTADTEDTEQEVHSASEGEHWEQMESVASAST